MEHAGYLTYIVLWRLLCKCVQCSGPYICILVLCAVYFDPINQLMLHLHSLAMSHCLTPVSMPQLSLLFESWTRWRVDGPKLLNPEKKEAFCLLLVFCFFFFLFRHRSRSNSYLTFTAALSYSKYNKFGLQGLWTIEYIRAFHGIARGFFFSFRRLCTCARVSLAFPLLQYDSWIWRSAICAPKTTMATDSKLGLRPMPMPMGFWSII